MMTLASAHFQACKKLRAQPLRAGTRLALGLCPGAHGEAF